MADTDNYSAAGKFLQYMLFAVSLLPFYLLPLWASEFSSGYGFSPVEVGVLLSMDMSAGTVASFLARFWITKLPWRPVLFLAIVIATLSNLGCLWASGHFELIMLRALAGFTMGTMMAFPYAVFASLPDPDREFSIALALQICLGALCLLLIPSLDNKAMSDVPFLFCAFFCLLPLSLLRHCPRFNPALSTLETEVDAEVRIDAFLILSLTAVGLFILALTAIWVFMEQLGGAGGLQSPTVSKILALGLLFSFAGSISPAIAVGFLERGRLITTGYLLLLLSICGTGSFTSTAVFAVSIIIYNFFYSFVMPLQSAWIAESDRSGRNAVLIPVAQGIGVSLGPLLAGFVNDLWAGIGIVITSLCLLCASLLCYYLAEKVTKLKSL